MNNEKFASSATKDRLPNKVNKNAATATKIIALIGVLKDLCTFEKKLNFLEFSEIS